MKIVTPEPRSKMVKDFEVGSVISVKNENNAKKYYMTTDSRGEDLTGLKIQNAVNLETGKIEPLLYATNAEEYKNPILYLNGQASEHKLLDGVNDYIRYNLEIYSLVGKNGDTRYFTIMAPSDAQIMDKIQELCNGMDYDNDIDDCAQQLKDDMKRLYNIELAFIRVANVFRI